ncbi:DnaB-like helicase C-terminal domain-containing protein (plasmid) [Bacillus carboniphilus]|uniref:DNA 5'-3' helicase n=1 Tax=Bacillus carboniphilus TaxID=86663 RepID=A0ABY9K1E3_9BACI|nr:DnaB-like helicase C-terminal domain-containing protein [Bacillus carboniphilus]WLR44418.1 DnaB-like helicase C-terminal domain-containing protein [Bacillus carboniphilus]
MTKKQVLELFKFLKSVYPSIEVDQYKIDKWALLLKDQDPARVMRMAEDHAMHKPFPPSVADLRERKSEAYNKNYTDVIREWEKKLAEQNQAERAILAAIIKDGEIIKDINLESQHFSTAPDQVIFQAMKSLEEKEEIIDVVALKMELGHAYHQIGGSTYISTICEEPFDPQRIKAYEKMILRIFKMRKASEIGDQLTKLEGLRDLSKAKDLINKMNDIVDLSEDDQEFDLSESLMEIQNDVETVREGVNGIETGYTDLDILLDGLSEEELIILGARPSVGKTAFALGITTNACEKNDFVDFFSLEMSDKSLLTRMMCSVGNINSMKIKNATARFNDDDWKRYTHAQAIVSNYKNNLAIYDNSKVTVQEIRSKVKASIRKHPDKRHLVVIDYLTLITGSGRKERHLEIGEITRSLKRMARDLKVPILLLAQLSRAVEQRRDKRPMLSDLRDSGEIEQDADKIMFLHRDDYYDHESENANVLEVIVAKNRNGAVGTACLAFVKEYNKFVNLEKRYAS